MCHVQKRAERRHCQFFCHINTPPIWRKWAEKCVTAVLILQTYIPFLPYPWSTDVWNRESGHTTPHFREWFWKTSTQSYYWIWILTLHWHWGKNSNYCPRQRDFKFTCICDHVIHKGWQLVKNWKSVRCTIASSEVLGVYKCHIWGSL
jgi:hypothetical protein